MIWNIVGIILFIGFIGLIANLFGFWVAFIVFWLLVIFIPRMIR
jgi:hypothetical protein